MENTPGTLPKIDNIIEIEGPEKSPEANKKNKKYPFNGHATNLIDKFLIFGYDQKTIEYTLKNIQETSLNEEFNTRYKICYFQDRPNLINEICNNYQKDLLDNEVILELLFPKNPKMFFLDKSDINSDKRDDDDALTKPYTIIFSLNPQDNEGSKKSYNGLGYNFYFNLEYRDKITNELKGYILYPITYCILSEYPYFNKFKSICKNVINQLMKETDEIPIDIFLYNIVKYTPSPIKKSTKINLGVIFNQKQMGQNDIDKTISNYKQERKSTVTIKDDDGVPALKFQQLSGYPLMDINLSFIFNLIPVEIIIEVFIFTFLEQDIIFYSSQPELLNMVMFIFSNLNYPFNDSIYYWHILSVSLDDFMNGTSRFVGKTCSSIIGILDEYNPKTLTTKRVKEHFVLDLDYKNFFYVYAEETEDVKQTMALNEYIKKCSSIADDEKKKVKDKNKIKSVYEDDFGLFKAIVELKDELFRRSKKVTKINYNEKNSEDKPSFLKFYEDESEEECFEANLRIQKAFFNFITTILKKYVQTSEEEEKENNNENRNETNYKTRNSVMNISIINSLNDDEKNFANNAGRIFQAKFFESSKYSNFVINYLEYQDTLDLFKIPYNFISEFIYYSPITEKNNLSEVDVFKLIDKFYCKIPNISLDKEVDKLQTKGSESKIFNDEQIYQNNNFYNLKFDNFAKFYISNLKNIIIREQEEDKECFYLTKKPTRNKIFGRKGFILSNKILMRYINFINNIDNFDDYFNFSEKDGINNSINDFENYNNNNDNDNIDSYESSEISEVIERHFIMQRCFSSYALIKFSLLNVFAVTRTLIQKNVSKNGEMLQIICGFCLETKTLARKYMLIFLNIFDSLKKYKLLDEKICNECIKIIAKHFDETKLLSTETMTKTLNEINLRKSQIKDIDDSTSKTSNSNDTDSQNIYFTMKDKLSKKFNEFLSLLETVFTGSFSKSFRLVGDQNELKYFERHYNQIKKIILNKIKNPNERRERELKKILDLKTPLSLYIDTSKILNKYLQNFSLDDSDLEDLYYYILCLIYYFKIPNIKEKWIEDFKKNVNDKNGKRRWRSKEKRIVNKSKNGLGEIVESKAKIILENLLNHSIPEIILMLMDLITEIGIKKQFKFE